MFEGDEVVWRVMNCELSAFSIHEFVNLPGVRGIQAADAMPIDLVNPDFTWSQATIGQKSSGRF